MPSRPARTRTRPTGRRGAGAVVLAVTAALLVAACGGGDDGADDAGGGTGAAPDRVTLQLDWVPNTNHTGFYVAQERGFYAEAGIDLEILPYAETPAEVAVGSGMADTGISFQDATTVAVAQGQPIVSVLALLQTAPDAIGVRADNAAITRPRDLDGKVYAGFGLPSEAPRIRAMIRNDGGTGDFTTVNLNTSAYEAVYDGSADFTIPFVTWQGVEAELSDRPLKLFRFTDYGIPDWYGVILIASSSFLTDRPDVAKRFVQATVRGFEFAAQQPAGAADILIEANADTFSNPELVRRSAQLLADAYYLDADGRFGTQTAEQWLGYTQFLFDNGALTDADGNPVDAPPSAEQLFTDALRSS